MALCACTVTLLRWLGMPSPSSDMSAVICRDEVQNWSVKQLRGFLQQRGVNTATFLEKQEFLERAKALLS